VHCIGFHEPMRTSKGGGGGGGGGGESDIRLPTKEGGWRWREAGRRGETGRIW
jgi:hypothetical protein